MVKNSVVVHTCTLKIAAVKLRLLNCMLLLFFPEIWVIMIWPPYQTTFSKMSQSLQQCKYSNVCPHFLLSVRMLVFVVTYHFSKEFPSYGYSSCLISVHSRSHLTGIHPWYEELIQVHNFRLDWFISCIFCSYLNNNQLSSVTDKLFKDNPNLENL